MSLLFKSMSVCVAHMSTALSGVSGSITYSNTGIPSCVVLRPLLTVVFLVTTNSFQGVLFCANIYLRRQEAAVTASEVVSYSVAQKTLDILVRHLRLT